MCFQLGHLSEELIRKLDEATSKIGEVKAMTRFFTTVIPRSKNYKEVGDFLGYTVYSFDFGSDTFYLSPDEDFSTYFFAENPVKNKNILENLKAKELS